MINTLAIAHKLSDSGFNEEQAEGIAYVVADVAEKQYQDLATKDFVTSQIQTVRAEISELRGEMNAMESNLRGEISTVRSEISTVHSEMNAMENNLHGEISTVRSEMNAKISALETRLVRWILVTFFSGMGILFAALSLFSG